jgi:hypothetical protein
VKSTDEYAPKLKWVSWLGRTAADVCFSPRQMPAPCLEEGFALQSAEHCALITIFRDHPIFQVPSQKTRDFCIFSCCLDSRPSKLFFSKCDGDLAKSFFHRLKFASNCFEKSPGPRFSTVSLPWSSPVKEPDQTGSGSHTSPKNAVLTKVVPYSERFISRKKVNLGSDIE